MKSFGVMVGLAIGCAQAAAAQTFAILPAGLLGGATPDARTPVLGYQIEARAMSGAYAASLTYRSVSLKRTCKTSFPPICGVDTPGGYLLMLGGSRLVVGGSVARLHAGLEGGVARMLDNAGSDRRTYGAFGARADLEFPIEHLLFRLGGVLDRTDVAWFGGATFGIGVRL